MTPRCAYFRLAESVEGHIIARICETLHMRPSEVLRNKYDPDIRFLWRRYWFEYKSRLEEYERIESMVED